MDVRNQDDVHIQTLFHCKQLGAFFVQQEGGDIDGHLGAHFAGVVLHRFFLNHAQNVQGGGFDAADHAGAGAARTGGVAAFAQSGFQALAAQFQKSETGEFAHLYAGAVFFECVAQDVFHIALVFGVFHVDEVDDDQAAQVAQAHLSGDFFGSFHIGFEGGVFDVRAACGACGVHVDGDEGFGVVDDDRAAGGQADAARERAFDLVFDLEAGKQRRVVFVEFQTTCVARHDVAHELGNLVVNFLIVHQNFADVGTEVVADGADEQRAFHKEQVGVVMRFSCFFDCLPELFEVVQIPFQLFRAAADAGGTRDDAHAVRNVELRHRGFEFLTLFAFDTAGYAAAARIVRHQYQIASGEADEGGQRRAFVAALVFFDLDDDFHAFFEHVLNARAPAFVAEEIRTRYFFKRQKAVAVGSVIDETRFQRRLDAGNDAFVDIAFALFFAQRFDVQIQQVLSVDDGNAQLFGLRCVE
ncbi:Uncharacterised protein [Neisseria gonorrhoeae]|nr:Uncharacterised protein [Neisseria gonorrhoeae]